MYKLIRESIFKRPEISIGYLEKQIKEYFEEYHDILISDNFSLEDFAVYHDLPIGKSAVLIQNLEDISKNDVEKPALTRLDR